MKWNISCMLLCPQCDKELDLESRACRSGHQYSTASGVLDLMPVIADTQLLQEAEHFDKAALNHGLSVEAHRYFHARIIRDYQEVLSSFVSRGIADYASRRVIIGDIGCGSESCIELLSQIAFRSVHYYGADISAMRMIAALREPQKSPEKWNVHFVRADAGKKLFPDGSIDIIFCNAALHHLNPKVVIKWISESLKEGGLFILNEPSAANPIAKLGRKMVSSLNTEHEHPLDPENIKRIAAENNLQLVSEEGMHYFTGPIAFLSGKLRLPTPVAAIVYALCHAGNLIVGHSSNRNYSFIQAYKKAN